MDSQPLEPRSLDHIFSIRFDGADLAALHEAAQRAGYLSISGWVKALALNAANQPLPSTSGSLSRVRLNA